MSTNTDKAAPINSDPIFYHLRKIATKSAGDIAKAAQYVLSVMSNNPTMASYNALSAHVQKWTQDPANTIDQVILFEECMQLLQQYAAQQEMVNIIQASSVLLKRAPKNSLKRHPNVLTKLRD